MVGTIVFVLIIIGVLYFCMSLFRNRKPKVTEFQLAELLEKCKEAPGQFLEEYKNTPVFVVGTVKRVSKAFGLEAGLFVVMEAGAKEEGKFVIVAPESKVVKGQELEVIVYISEITIDYDRNMIEESISVEGESISAEGYLERMERIDDGFPFQRIPPTSEEEKIFLVPAWGFRFVAYKAYKGFGHYYYYKTFIHVSLDGSLNGRSISFLFDSYLKKSELAPIFAWEDHEDNVKIKGKKEEESTDYYTRVRHCKILGMQKISLERR